MAHLASNPPVTRIVVRAATAFLMIVSALFLAAHWVHLSADFPNHSPWMDWAKYTDEGWYGDAAIRHYQRGHWYVYGDFNPAAALPVWPLLELLVFRFTGVSLVAARGLTVSIFALILVASYLLLRRWQRSYLTSAVAVLLLTVSPFCFVFMRMAILEPLLILLMLLALLAASTQSLPPPQEGSWRIRHYLPILALGILLPLMVLTKTTAVFLFPAVFWILWAKLHYAIRPFFRAALLSSAIAAVLWLSYFFLFVRPHFLTDYRYLFSANAYTGITLATARQVIADTIKDGLWVGRLMYPLSLAVSFGAVVLLRRRCSPLIVALLLWVAGYGAFLAYHNNLQPRYYLVVAVPLMLLLPVAIEDLVFNLAPSPAGRAAMVAVAAIACLSVALPDSLQTIAYVRKPEYTFVEAAARVRKLIDADPSQSRLVLSISGSNLSLMTGLPSICDDFGTMELAQRVAMYHPGWYVAWNQVDDDKMEALWPLYRLHRVAEFPAMDDPDRNLLIVYRLDPRDSESLRPKRRKPPVPKLLQTRVGQQPSTAQLVH